MGSISAVRIPVGDRDLPAALALPDRPARHAGIVVIHEPFGLNDDIRAIASRLADRGYVSLAPDFMAGLGPRPVCVFDFFGRHLGPVGEARGADEAITAS